MVKFVQSTVGPFHKLSLVDLSKGKKNSRPSYSKSFIAFIEFWDSETAVKAVKLLNSVTFKDVQLAAEMSKTPILNPSICFNKQGEQLIVNTARAPAGVKGVDSLGTEATTATSTSTHPNGDSNSTIPSDNQSFVSVDQKN